MHEHAAKPTLEVVEQAIELVLDTRSIAVTPDTRLIGDLGAESIDLLDLSCELEKLTGIELEFRKLLQQKRQDSKEQIVDITVQEVLDALEHTGTM